MFNNEGPFTRAALRMLREFTPTMVVWIVAVVVWGWATQDEPVRLAVGWIAITVPYLIEHHKVFRR